MAKNIMHRFDSIDTPDDEIGRGSRVERKGPYPPAIPRSLLILLVCTVVGCIMFACIVILPAILHWEVGEQFDQRTFKGPPFALRITAYHERGTVLGGPGGFYRYEVKTSSDWQWRTIIMFRLPKPEPIPGDHLQRVTDLNAYFFHGCMFGVTKDGGKSWSIKGGSEDPPIFSGQLDINTHIEAVSIGQDGVGTMQLYNYDPVRRIPLPSINVVTYDFGQNWLKN